MSLATLVARCSVVALVGWIGWALGCASIIGVDDYKVAGSGNGTPTGTGTGTGGTGTGGTGGDCLANVAECTAAPNNCCSGVCFQNPRDPGGARFCAAGCMTGADCQSGCCTTAPGATKTSCAPKGLCPATCIAIGDPCENVLDCCNGNYCVISGTDSACLPTCRTVADCGGFGCCEKLSDSAVMVCLPPDLCP